MLKVKFNSRKLKSFLSRYKFSLLIIGVALLFSIGSLMYASSQSNVFVAPKIKATKKVVATGSPAPLTGLLVDKSIINRRALGVVVENHPDSRPQSGYNDADLVYETLAEGGITRTLAIFHSKDSKEIGPIRSARPYFIDWISEVSGIFSHVGGSSDALSQISNLKYPDLNQFGFGSYYWRSTDRYAPHNVYTTTEKLFAAAKSVSIDISTPPTAMLFKDDISKKSRPTTQNIGINFSGPDYAVSYTYDPKDNSYSRSIAGVAHKDKITGIQIKPKNVVVQLTSVQTYVDSVGVQGVKIETIGSGSGYVFQDGKTIKATWIKDSRTSRTKFFDSDSKEILFNKGQTWFEVVPIGQAVTY